MFMEGLGSPVSCDPFLEASIFATALVEGPSHLVRYANPAFCRLLDKPLSAIVGLDLTASFPRCEECAALIDRVARTGAAETHTELRASSPQEICWSYSAWPVRRDADAPRRTMIQASEISEFRRQSTEMNQALMLSAVRQHELAEVADNLAAQMRTEISERKLGEEALKTSEARLMLALDSAKASTWEWNLVTNKLKFQEQGVPLPSADSTHEAVYRVWRSLVYRDDRPAVDAAVERANGGSIELNVEFRLNRKANVARWILARGRLATMENGQPLIYSGIFLDITERKYAEDVLLRSEKLAGVGRLAATLAHEINNPLDAAINCIYIAKTSPDLPETARLFLETADEELQRVTHMTRQSLGFYREATVPSIFSVNLVIESVIRLLGNRIKANSVTIDLQFAKDPLVEGVFGELRQVFVNLIANSLDAIEPRGKISLKSSVGVEAGSTQRRVRITVADNGKGIAPEKATRIFEPFFTTKGELGTGLGLWVTKQIIEQHGGAIRVRSSTGGKHRGSVFSVTLPYPATLNHSHRVTENSSPAK